MQMQVGRGLKAIAKAGFDAKVAKLANPTRATESYRIVDGKVNGVPLNVLTDKVIALGHRFTHTADTLYVAKRSR